MKSLRNLYSISLPPPTPWAPNNITITNGSSPSLYDEYGAAQRRFIASAIRGHNDEVLQGTPWKGTKNNNDLWVFVFDDDA